MRHISPPAFRRKVLGYYRRHGRDFPWRRTRDPYRILVSEIMLQQTQTTRVREKYPQFLRTFPNVSALNRAPLAKILRVWQGMGYNRRAIYLKGAARGIVARFHGAIPRGQTELESFPGVGAATASAIRAFAFNEPAVFIETNIRRVFIHFFFPRRAKVHDREILPLVARTLDQKDPRRWYFALMDYGAMLGGLRGNPNRRSAHYARQSPFRGSERELRGKVLRAFLKRRSFSRKGLGKLFPDDARLKGILRSLLREEFLRVQRGRFSLT